MSVEVWKCGCARMATSPDSSSLGKQTKSKLRFPEPFTLLINAPCLYTHTHTSHTPDERVKTMAVLLCSVVRPFFFVSLFFPFGFQEIQQCHRQVYPSRCTTQQEFSYFSQRSHTHTHTHTLTHSHSHSHSHSRTHTQDTDICKAK